MYSMQSRTDQSRITQSSRRWRPTLLSTALTAVLTLWMSNARADHVYHNISAGMLTVSQIPSWGTAYLSDSTLDDNTNCIVTLGLSINDFRAGTFNRADYNVQAGPTAANQYLNGILIPSIAQNGRTNAAADSLPGETTNAYPIPTIITNANGSYRICSWNVSAAGTGGSAVEYNVNVAGAFFPYANYLGGYARNSTGANGSATVTNDTLTASPGIVYGVNYIELGGGKGIVDLRNLGYDSRTNGILLVTGAKDENNFGLSQVNVADGTWNLFLHDNATSGASTYEQDPIAFVFIPKTNTFVVSGRVNGDGTIDAYSGSSPQFTAALTGTGTYLLQVNGRGNTNGILIISAEGGGAFNLDNIVSYQPTADGTGWVIQSRDTPGNGLQTVNNGAGGTEPAFSFVYIPAPLPGVTVTPTNNLFTTQTGGTAAFTVVLEAPPTANVTINVSSSDTTEGMVDQSTLTFTTSNWSTPQTVTITGQNDSVAAGNVPYTIVLAPASSTDARYNGIDPVDVAVVNVNNLGNNIAASATSFTTTDRGGTATFTVNLTAQPAADVVVPLASSNTGIGKVSPASLTFTAANYATAQTVTVTGAVDLKADGNQAYNISIGPAVSADVGYNGVHGPTVAGSNLDTDTAGFSLSATNLVVSESGTTATFTVALSSQPIANVTLSLSSSDLTEGTVSPASLTFTTGNWNTPQTVTVTGVDDLVMDGNILWHVASTITSTDPLYAGLTPPSMAVTTLDNEAAVTLPSGNVIYGLGDPGVGLDGQATVVDAATNYSGGKLTVTITAGAIATDRLAIRNDGTGAGQIGVSGSTVSYGGTSIGTFAGGTGAAPLVVTFNAAATPDAAQALLRAVTYNNTSTSTAAGSRTVTVGLANGLGGTSTLSKTVLVGVVHVYDYQPGADFGFGTYQGAVDVEISPSLPDTTFPIGTIASGMWVDYVSSENPQVLLGFTNIFGNGLGQIPLGATIVSAQLILSVNNSGDGGRFYRMLVPWDPDAETWDSMGDGVQTDDVEACSTNSAFLGLSFNTGLVTGGSGPAVIGVTTDLQIWANGQANEGWMIAPWDFGSDGTGWSPCEDGIVTNRPRLHVVWVPAGIQMASFQQGVNDYASAYDTSIRQNAPDADRSAVTALFCDWAVSGTSDNEQVLLRFDNIFGSGTNQIPSGATVYAAELDLTGDVGNAPGHGGQFYALLEPWQDTNSTWNSWGGGIQPDGVKAATTATAVAGNASRFPLVQATVNTIDLTADVQAWASGARPNYGWVMLPWPNGTDGWGFSSAEAANVGSRPQLRVYYAAGAVLLRITSVTRAASSVSVGFSGPAGAVCSVLRAGTVMGSYASVGSATIQPDGTASFTDNSPPAGKAFYRISIP